ncbi:hypothetical protein DHW03_16495 [Pedobacter yonginense]|uniref:Exosortase/archaeosortase family protein n=1 Tax=Pedobacter yonginense TaxID=651869 RepID=A0A317EHU8_9SPHI|nr:archaeosortase/exosortase family protein [Pedobacter yonginense]PWS26380.1 hypothetical protein DHW03_16495 [Pedobacter yonginense]
MNEIELKQAKKQADKKALKFIISLFILYIFFSQGNLFMNSVLSPGSRFYNEFIAEHFNYIQGLKTALITCAVWIIKLFGFYVIYNKSDVMVVAGPYLRVNYSCLGLGVMSFLTAFVLAFPASWKATFKMMAIGLITIFVLNVCRIAGLGVLLGFFESQRNNFTYHHEIFNVIVYICIFVMLYLWIKKNTGSNASENEIKKQPLVP